MNAREKIIKLIKQQTDKSATIGYTEHKKWLKERERVLKGSPCAQCTGVCCSKCAANNAYHIVSEDPANDNNPEYDEAFSLMKSTYGWIDTAGFK